MTQDPQNDSRLIDAPSVSAGSDEQSSFDQTIEDYRQRYGLSRDPFGADPYFPFFTGAQRRELLDQITHLCQFGSGMSVVLGERGVGKTRVALALYETIGNNEACFVSALPTLHSSALLTLIAQHFGVAGVEEDSRQSQEALRELGQSYGNDSLALVLIDDAHDLDDQSLKAILDLIQPAEQDGGSLRIVLFGDISLSARMKKLSNPHTPVSDFYIERFALGETVDYLNFRMEMADYLGPEMFSEAQVEPWWRQAAGQITHIHRSAREHLLETVLPPLANRPRPFPIVHLVAIAVLGGAVLMTLLYRSEDTDSDENLSVVQRVPINLQQPARVEPSPADITEEVATSAGSNMQVSSTSASVTESESPLVISDQTVEQVPAASEKVRSTRNVLPRVAAEPPEAVLYRPADVARPAPAVRSTQSVTQISARLSADEEALMSWNATDYTLQLLGVSSEKAARDFIADQLNQEDLLMFKTVRQGRDWFVVVAGRYADTAEARAAISDLPQEQASAGPWPRAMKVIHQELKHGRSEH